MDKERFLYKNRLSVPLKPSFLCLFTRFSGRLQLLVLQVLPGAPLAFNLQQITLASGYRTRRAGKATRGGGDGKNGEVHQITLACLHHAGGVGWGSPRRFG